MAGKKPDAARYGERVKEAADYSQAATILKECPLCGGPEPVQSVFAMVSGVIGIPTSVKVCSGCYHELRVTDDRGHVVILPAMVGARLIEFMDRDGGAMIRRVKQDSRAASHESAERAIKAFLDELPDDTSNEAAIAALRERYPWVTQGRAEKSMQLYWEVVDANP